MKKIVSLILLILMLSLAFVSCSEEPAVAPEGMKLVSGDDCAYNLFVPENWKGTNGYGTYGAYTSDASNVNVSTFTAADIKVEESETNEATETTQATDKTAREQYIDAYWAMCEKSYAEDLNGFSVVEAGKKVTPGGLEAKEYIYTAKYEGTDYKMQTTVTYAGGVMYILTYTAKADNYGTHTDEIAKIVSEFKFK